MWHYHTLTKKILSDMRYTTRDLETLKQKNLIRGYVLPEKRKELKESNGKIVVRHFTKRSKEKDFIAWYLFIWAQQRGLILKEEFRFHPERLWRFDYCIESLKLGFEYNGIISEKSRHTTITGYTGDMDKLNAAQELGWAVLQFTPLNYKTLPQALKKFEK